MKTIIFDLETKRNPDSVSGGWSNKRELGISSGVAWVSWLRRYVMYREDRIPLLVDLINEADLVVGFNSINFDVPLLEAQGYELHIKQHCDLMALCERPHRKFVGLDELAWFTLGRGKIANGKHAPELAELGRWDELFEYNTDDVVLTRMLFEFVAEWGYLIDANERISLCVAGGVDAWRPPPPKESRVHNYDAATPKQMEFIKSLWKERGVPDWQPITVLTKSKASDLIKQLQGEVR